LGGIPEIQGLDELEDAGQLRRNNQGRVIAHRAVQHDLSARYYINPLQVEACQGYTDHAVGQHQPGPRLGQSQYLGHACRAGQGEEKLRAVQVEGVQFNLSADQLPPVKRDGRAVHRDFGFVGQRFGAQTHFVEHEPLNWAEPHAVEL
jgi:hypothetical protein